MRRGICVKCRSDRVYVLSGRAGGYSEVDFGSRWSQESYLHFYACAACGYIESYVNPDRLDKIVKHGWPLRPS